MSDEQHREDTKYLQWSDGMYVMLEDLECDYELALIENSLRDSVYFYNAHYLRLCRDDDCAGVFRNDAGRWCSDNLYLELTRAQVLYISTGETNI